MSPLLHVFTPHKSNSVQTKSKLFQCVTLVKHKRWQQHSRDTRRKKSCSQPLHCIYSVPTLSYMHFFAGITTVPVTLTEHFISHDFLFRLHSASVTTAVSSENDEQQLWQRIIPDWKINDLDRLGVEVYICSTLSLSVSERVCESDSPTQARLLQGLPICPPVCKHTNTCWQRANVLQYAASMLTNGMAEK